MNKEKELIKRIKEIVSNPFVQDEDDFKAFVIEPLLSIIEAERQEAAGSVIADFEYAMKYQNRVAGLPAKTCTTLNIFGEQTLSEIKGRYGLTEKGTNAE